MEFRSTRNPDSSAFWRPVGGMPDNHWPLARVGHYAFETDAFYSDSFC